jgi:GT2 family glycosyltransferase
VSANPAVAASLEMLREESRRTIFEAIGDSADVTYFPGIGNVGDALIQAGNARLLASLRPRQAPLTEIPFRRGHTAVLSGGGAWCAPYHEIMPHALREAERRFERVVVLPSSFDPSVPAVRQALTGTAAVVLAREPESFRRIQPLCRTALALDAAFFFDFDPYRQAGKGTLNAYRTDRESAGEAEIPADNDDISATSRTLDEWLERIARHAVVRTDRAHVMIAAALLGKRVEYRPSLYHKVPAIAEFALREYPVCRSAPAARPAVIRRAPGRAKPDPDALRGRIRARALAARARRPAEATGLPRVTVVLLSWNRRPEARRAIESLREHVRLPWRLCLVDNGSDPDVAAAIAADARTIPGAEIHLLPENRGCAGGRAFAIERVTTDYVMFLDDDAEVFPGTAERLVAELDSHPEALAATGEVVLPDGSLHHFGGRIAEEGSILRFVLEDAGRPFGDPAIAGNGACGWIPGTCALFRTSALLAQPLDPEMRAYFEDNEWCLRAGKNRPGAFRRVRGAFALHFHQPRVTALSSSPSQIAEFVRAISRFDQRHGRILHNLFDLVPELRWADGTPDIAAARLFLEIAERDSADAFVLRWIGGGLAPLFHHDAESDLLREKLAAGRAREATLVAELAALSGSRFGRIMAFYWRLRSSLRRRRPE